jgi:DNA-binding XRE family transcriptional regulator
MLHSKLPNSLRALRRQSGLTQQELATILGCADGGIVSRYERSRYLPPLPIALAIEAVFRVPVASLFSGVRLTIDEAVEKQLEHLEFELRNASGKSTGRPEAAKTLLWLANRRRQKSLNAAKP